MAASPACAARGGVRGLHASIRIPGPPHSVGIFGLRGLPMIKSPQSASTPGRRVCERQPASAVAAAATRIGALIAFGVDHWSSGEDCNAVWGHYRWLRPSLTLACNKSTRNRARRALGRVPNPTAAPTQCIPHLAPTLTKGRTGRRRLSRIIYVTGYGSLAHTSAERLLAHTMCGRYAGHVECPRQGSRLPSSAHKRLRAVRRGESRDGSELSTRARPAQGEL